MEKRVQKLMFLLASTFLFKGIGASNSVLDGDFQVTGNLQTDGTFTVSGETLLESGLEVYATTTLRGDRLVLQKSSGTTAPIIEFKDPDSNGGLIRGYIKANEFPGDKGIYMTVDGTNNSLGVNGDKSIVISSQADNNMIWMYGDPNVSGDAIINGDLVHGCKNKACIYIDSDMTYTLGTNLTFDKEMDAGDHVMDGMGVYMSNQSGYYLITLHLVGDQINIPKTINGTPIALLEVKQTGDLSGSSSLNTLLPLICFGNEFNYTLSGVVRLNYNDIIYPIFSFWGITENGYEQLEGTVNLKGSNTARASYMNIHYLSSSVY